MKNLIKDYIQDHRKAWALTTQKTEEARLNAIKDAINGDPDTLWKSIETLKPYSRVTTWIRVTDFWNWARDRQKIEVTENPYTLWRKKNARLFKHAYQRKTPEISYEEAKRRIQSLRDPAIQRKAFELLHSGLRYSESNRVSSGYVVGKGGKVRSVFLPNIPGPKYQGSYEWFLKNLHDINLTPHMLRKLKATELLRKGMDQVSLCEVMGWSDFDTAKSYLAPLKKEAMEKYFE